MSFRLTTWFLPLLTISCQVAPYAPPPQLALVESVEVEILDFEGRPDARALIKGRLSSGAAQLVDVKQSRIDGILYLEVLEQTPRGAALLTNLTEAPPFETRVPIELLGLEPGPCRLSANGLEVTFEIPRLQAVMASTEKAPAAASPSIRLIDEFIPIEDITGGVAGVSSATRQ